VAVDEGGKVTPGERETAALHTDITLVAPVQWDHVRVMRGAEQGLDAQLIGVDGVDGVLKSKDQKGSIKILDMSLLGKLYGVAEGN
jgi:hypothetical protein